MAMKRKYQNSGSSSNAGSRSGSRSSSRSSSNASGNTMNFSGANIGSGIMDNSRTVNKGSGKRSPFSNYQDGDGFGTSNMPTSGDIARLNRSNRGGLKSPSKPKKAGPRKGKMQGKMKKTIEKMPKPPEPKKQGARFDSNAKGLKRGRKGPISDRRAKKLDRKMRRNAL